MDRDYTKDAITDADTERRMQDAATALLDICIHSMPEGCRGNTPVLGGAMALAVQTIFMADMLKAGAAIDKRQVTDAEKRAFIESMPERMRGLGLGVGHCIGTMNSESLQAIAQVLVAEAMVKGIEDHRRVWQALRK